MSQVRQLERTVGLKDLTVAEMEGRLREMSATTFDGVFVWRISDFAKKRQDAIAGRAPAMFSPGNPDWFQPVEGYHEIRSLIQKTPQDSQIWFEFTDYYPQMTESEFLSPFSLLHQ